MVDDIAGVVKGRDDDGIGGRRAAPALGNGRAAVGRHVARHGGERGRLRRRRGRGGYGGGKLRELWHRLDIDDDDDGGEHRATIIVDGESTSAAGQRRIVHRRGGMRIVSSFVEGDAGEGGRENQGRVRELRTPR